PGCFPTAELLGLAPLIKNNMIDEKAIIIDAKTGVSGAGRNASPTTHFSEMNDNLKIYKVNEHQNIPEIEQTLNEWNHEAGAVTFSPHLVPMTRGIMPTKSADATDIENIDQLFNLYKDSYQDSYVMMIKEKE